MLIPPLAFWTPPAAKLLLDIYPGAAAAWSTLQLSSSVTNVVRLRRGDTNAEEDFTARGLIDGTMMGWGLSGNTTNDIFITKFYDQSGNGIDLPAPATGNQPQIVVNGALQVRNGKPTIKFDGADDHMKTAAQLLSTNEYSIFAAVDATGPASVEVIAAQHEDGGPANRTVFMNIDSVPELGMFFNDGAASYSGKVSASPLDFGVYEAIATNDDYFLSVDGGTLTEVVSNQPLTPLNTPFTVGALGGGTSQFFDGSITGMVVWDSDQTSNRTGIYDGITAGLPTFNVQSQALSDRFIQGLVVSGADAWVTSTPLTSAETIIRRYDTATWTEQASNTKDAITPGFTMSSAGDMSLVDGILYLAGGKAFIVELDPTTLAYIDHRDLSGDGVENINMVVLKDGFWYVGETRTDTVPRIWRYDNDWTNPTIVWTAPIDETAFYIVQGGVFVGNYLFTGLHTPEITVFQLQGDGTLDIVDLLSVESDDIQGLSYDGGDLYFANRTPNTATGSRVSWLPAFSYP